MYAWILLATVVIALLGWAYTRGPGIVTPIPLYLVSTVENRRGGFLTLWRIIILLVTPFVFLLIMELSTSDLTIWVLAALVGSLLVPQIRRLLDDVWNFRFFRFGGD